MAELASGKDHMGENFPVASWLVRPDARGPVMAFYRFARGADDIADDPVAGADVKLRLLGEMRSGLDGAGMQEAVALAAVCRERGVSLDHARDLLAAFERDCRVQRCGTWADLLDYCRYSAMPVGRFVLDVHDEDRGLWAMNDALCAALQIINHLQDCGKDFRAIGRIYLPQESLAAAGVDEAALGEARGSAALLGVIRELAGRTRGLLAQAAPFADGIADWRLALEVAVIQHLAEDLCGLLLARDPLSERVHHSKGRAAWLALGAILQQGWRRLALGVRR